MKHDQLPTRTQSVIFRSKALLLQIKRGFENIKDREIRSFPALSAPVKGTNLAESITPLWTEKEPGEQFLQAGKIQNLRIAVSKLNGVTVPANKIFSFWKHVGKTTRRRGYVAGRELREGCIIPNVGGGLCQISNALYDAALKAEFEIVERHAHTQVVRGSLAEQDRDATVFWNYVDLRFKAPGAFTIQAELDSENLIVRFVGEKPTEKPLVAISRNRHYKPAVIGSCATCGVNDCFRVVKPPKNPSEFGRTAFLVDEFVPEFDRYIGETQKPKDVLLLPLDGKRFRRANYAWNTNGFGKTRQSLLTTAVRSYKSRKLAAQGASRQRNLLAMYERLADDYAAKLTYDCLHLVIQQNLLPFLWENGHLGGRTYDVLMTALPMRALQERLDFARSLHPESTTLSDFRADEALVEAEVKALHGASKIITSHTGIAELFPDRAVVIDWKQPTNKTFTRNEHSKPVIVFPASTVGRKGIYELREAIREADVKIIGLGPVIEQNNFWDGFDFERGGQQTDWLAEADVVVLPAFVEHRPRRLLLAAANGVPVIASDACGVQNVKGVKTVITGNADALRRALLEILQPDNYSAKRKSAAAQAEV